MIPWRSEESFHYEFYPKYRAKGGLSHASGTVHYFNSSSTHRYSGKMKWNYRSISQMKSTTFNFSTWQSIWVVAAEVVQSHALNWRMVVVTGSKNPHIFSTSGCQTYLSKGIVWLEILWHGHFGRYLTCNDYLVWYPVWILIYLILHTRKHTQPALHSNEVQLCSFGTLTALLNHFKHYPG